MANGLSQIEHIVVLMQENRSFDNLLGWQFEADVLHGKFNLDDRGERVPVWRGADFRPGCRLTTLPDPDPGELFTDINHQLFEQDSVPDDVDPETATMGGFVRNYLRQPPLPHGQALHDPRSVMHCFDPDEVPVTSRLAASFRVADRWFASAPCQTFPNRLFAHAATAGGYVNNLPAPAKGIIKRLPFDMPTIFNQVTEHVSRHDLLPFDKGWRLYFHDIPMSILLSRLWEHLDHFHGYRRFQEDVAKGELQHYSFIEPRYFPHQEHRLLPNDHHSPHDVTLGEQLVADVYNTLRASRYWTKSLLIVISDEHGGCYDHVPPPRAQPPEDGRPARPGQDAFPFNRYGARVPALLISPYIRQSPEPLRPAPEGPPFDHTSVIRTVRERFAPSLGPLTRRDAVAPSLAFALDSEVVNMGPEHIPVPPYDPTPEEVHRAAHTPLNDFQRALLCAAAVLPHRDVLREFLESLRNGLMPSTSPLNHETPAEARPFLKSKLAEILGRDEGE
ncbi:MAG TPA: alkaline phosphatase family protein [Thermoanaerobaculia bacterium]